MSITALGYIGVHSSRLEDWNALATGLIGMQKVDGGGATSVFRMDDRKQRFVVTGEAGDRLAFTGWETGDAASMDALASRIDNSGVKVARATAAEADARGVAAYVYFDDPGGNRMEIFHGAAIADSPFRPGRPISGFRTGPLGMGHAVLNVTDVEPLLPFYRDVLGFQISDFGLKPYPLYFFHVNGRHHSFAMVGSGRAGIHHFMVEVASLDDVGQGYDLAQLDDGRVAYTLGRHTNDFMTSFYTHTPSGFFIEYGWGGRVIDTATWRPHETFDGPSFWGHERLYMPEDQRARLRDMRLSAAARGVRAPIDCVWLDSVVARQ